MTLVLGALLFILVAAIVVADDWPRRAKRFGVGGDRVVYTADELRNQRTFGPLGCLGLLGVLMIGGIVAYQLLRWMSGPLG
jgi:hypothetical protein